MCSFQKPVYLSFERTQISSVPSLSYLQWEQIRIFLMQSLESQTLLPINGGLVRIISWCSHSNPYLTWSLSGIVVDSRFNLGFYLSNFCSNDFIRCFAAYQWHSTVFLFLFQQLNYIFLTGFCARSPAFFPASLTSTTDC